MSGVLNNIYPGTIVNLRSRLWRVDDIQNNILSATSIQGAPVQKRRFYIPYEKIERSQISLPDPSIVGIPSAQEILTRAYRLSMIHGTAPFLGLQRSRVIPESFQMVPVVMALDMPRVRILIADDVGLGKTIEGGLIISELFAHNRASRLLVMCPANLRIQWKEALYYFFHIDAKIISSNTLRSLERSIPPGASPWDYYPYLIVSMDYAKAPRNLPHIEKKWDVVLIDEAHNLAKPHQISKNQRINKDLWTLAEKVSKSANHLILLTATPHNGYTDTFASLLSLLEIGAVTGDIHEPVINRQIAQHHVCQRRRKDVENDFGFAGEENPFPLRDQSETYIEPNSEENECIERLELLQQFILDVAKDRSFQQQRLSQWTVMHLHRRALSSPEALRISLKNRLKKVNDRIKKSSAESSDEAGLTDEEARSEVLDGDPGERLSLDEAGDRFDSSCLALSHLHKEKEMIQTVLSPVSKITPTKDSKLQALLNNALRVMIRRDPRVIIFTKYKDTLDYLAKNLTEHRNYHDVEVFSIHGGLSDEERRDILLDFECSGKGVLIATDCLSEGINLQYMAAQMIHYELPWNPNRLEQRNGRIDRYGQIRRPGGEHKVFINTLVVNDPLEAGICKVLVEKASRIRAEYGFAPPFFGDELSVLDLIRESGIEVKVGQTSLNDFLDPKPQIPIKDPFSDELIERMRQDTFYGQSSINLSEVKGRMKKTETIIGSREEIQKFTETCLQRFQSSMTLNGSDKTFKITLGDSRLISHVGRDTLDRVIFDPLRGKENPRFEVIDIGHPLIQKLIELGKELVFSNSGSYGRTSAISNDVVNKPLVQYTFLARYTIHTEPISVVEELLTAGISLDGEEKYNWETLTPIVSAPPKPWKESLDQVRIDLKNALSLADQSPYLEEEALVRCRDLIEERKRIKESLEAESDHSWLEGYDTVSLASVDLLTLTLYYPAGGTV